MKNKLVVFLHIEKNGGITLHEILHKAYPGYITPRSNYGKIFSSKDLANLRKVYPIKIQGIGGHRISSLENYHPDQFLFTFLRNPIDRYLSHLNYQITNMGIDWDIEKFIEDKYFNDFQTFRISPNRNLKDAIDLLDKKFSFIGLMDDYNNSLNYLSEKMGNPLIRRKYVKKNVISKPNKKYVLTNLDAKIKSKIIENNKNDIILYNHVKDKIYSLYQKEYANFDFKNKNVRDTSIIENKLYHLKRKLSTFYIGRIVQPFYLKQTKNIRGK